MPRQPSKRRSFWTPFLFFLLLIIGVFIGFQLNKYIGSKRPITTVIERNDRLEELINLINDRYVDSVSTDTLYQDAITGILKHLDPHTTYIPASEVAAASAGLEGKFKGVGIELFNILDTMMVSKVIPNSPAQDAGIHLGDRLIAIDSTIVVNKNLDVSDLKKILAKKSNDTLVMTILRPGSKVPEKLILKKGVVPLYSVVASYMAGPETGYIKIGRFSAMTFREFNKALKLLQKQGMKQLILDLRGNPGGYVDAATAVANEFIGDHRILVYTQGRAVEREDYYADNKGLFEKGRLTVLVDVQTASAAEILTGAIQDWDRGVVIGSRTFGKGLVQQQFELGDGSLFRLTIARYYTPSGRCIQRPYAAGKQAYEASYLNRLYHPGASSAKNKDSTKVSGTYYSMIHHRPLNGGGGIVPDIITSVNPPYTEEAMLKVTSGKWMEEIVFSYYIKNHSIMSHYTSGSQLASHFKIPGSLMDRFKIRMEMLYPNAVYELWQNPYALDYIRSQLKAKMIQLMYGDNAYYEFLNRQDVDVLRAETIINRPAYLKIIEGEAA